MNNKIIDGVMALCVADALGVPVEFIGRESLRNNPVVDMRGYGTYNQPPGTWSDDTSMTLCLVESLTRGLDYKDIMVNYHKWMKTGAFTPYGETFDIGNATSKAINNFEKGIMPLECGGLSEIDNGNGSLMRILPVVFYLQSQFGTELSGNDEAMQIVHNVSALTHAHKRSLIACGIYSCIASLLPGTMPLATTIELGIFNAFDYYQKHDEFKSELKNYKRLKDIKIFAATPEQKIKSSGYVVDTLEAAVWCLLNTKNYRECVLKAVNLGLDTDTVAAVAGGLAGLYYGYENIPKEWIAAVARRDYIDQLCNDLYKSLNRRDVEKLCSYISYFETATRESVCEWEGPESSDKRTRSKNAPKYDITLRNFIQKFYETNLVCQDYSDVFEKQGLRGLDSLAEIINKADFELLKAILTAYILQERFNEGLWVKAVEEKIFHRILVRMKVLMQS